MHQLPQRWETAGLKIADSTVDDLPALQGIYDANPTIQGWTGVEAEGATEHPMRTALTEGVLPPGGEKASFRLQSIRIRAPGHPCGFLAGYHGFPSADVFWVTVLAFDPRYQRQGHGSEVLRGLSETLQKLETYRAVRTSVNLENVPSLRLCVRAGFDKILKITQDPGQPDGSEWHMILEKTLL